MRRVLLLSGFWPPHVGGIERYSQALAGELVSRGVEVDAVACMTGEEQLEGAPGLRMLLYEGSVVGRIPLPRLFSRNNWRLARVVRRADYDVVIAMSHYYVANILTLAAKRRAGVRIWVNHASGHVPAVGGSLLSSAVHVYEHLMAVMMRRLTNRWAGVSVESAAWMQHFLVDGASVLRNAVSLREPSDLEGIRHERRVRDVLFVGRLQPGKGALQAVEILEVARSQLGNDLTLTVAGDGQERGELERLRRTRPWLTVLGPISRDDVYGLMASRDVLLFPSSYPEGLPTVLLEAGLHRLPVVTFSVGGVSDIAPTGRELFVVTSVAEAARTLVELHEHPELAESSASLLRYRVLQHFTWARTVEALDELARERP